MPLWFRRAPRTPQLLWLLVVLLAVPIVAPIGGQASHGVACGYSYDPNDATPDACGISFYGFPLTVFADACARNSCTSGPAHVHVKISVSTSAVVLAECEASSNDGYVSCDDEVSLGEAVTSILPTVPLDCSVTGSGRGMFTCGSGCVTPSQGAICEVLATALPTP